MSFKQELHALLLDLRTEGTFSVEIATDRVERLIQRHADAVYGPDAKPQILPQRLARLRGFVDLVARSAAINSPLRVERPVELALDLGLVLQHVKLPAEQEKKDELDEAPLRRGS